MAISHDARLLKVSAESTQISTPITGVSFLFSMFHSQKQNQQKMFDCVFIRIKLTKL